MNTGAREWDAETYDARLRPAVRVGRWRCSSGSSCAATRPCSTPAAARGRVTAMLIERLPDGRVIAVDGSAAMVEKARERLGARADERSSPTWSSSSSTSRSTSSSRPRSSTGSPTTTRSSRGCARRCSPAAGSSPSAAARATSPATPRRSRRSPPSARVRAALRRGASALELRRAGGDRGAPARGRLRRGPLLAASRSRCSPREPARVHCAPSSSARYLDQLPEELRDRFVDAVLRARGRARWSSTTCASTSRPRRR